MNDLVSEITSRLSAGESREQIYVSLLSNGHTVFEVDAAYYSAFRSRRGAPLQSLTTIFSFLGFVIIAIAAIYYVSSAWNNLSTFQRVLLVLVITGAFGGLAFWSEKRVSLQRFVQFFLIVSASFLGVAIVTVIDAASHEHHSAPAFAIWAATLIAVGLVLKRDVLQVYGIALLFVTSIALNGKRTTVGSGIVMALVIIVAIYASETSRHRVEQRR